ncbi:staygreen family protein [Clostridium sp. JS66]|uniref:staygreen family protein n=1 Tax=Clostridium sp. JS66 TaxID=3064705 RepID=UPI00298E76FD|nr:staygreen family protein [Clostridium sp. JS66]WPC44496.1 staygreen family protein [Clostridium sp. JS66]
MKKLNPEKLFVKFKDGVNSVSPIILRRYTLTHSDKTAELFLVIGLTYAYENITSERDEVLAEWKFVNNQYVLNVFCHVGGENNKDKAALRYKIFIRELPLALEAICYGDRKLFEVHQFLKNSPIMVRFESIYPQYNGIKYFGMPKNYL